MERKRGMSKKREEVAPDGENVINVQGPTNIIYLTDSEEARVLIYPESECPLDKSLPFESVPVIFKDLYISRVHDYKKALRLNAPNQSKKGSGMDAALLFEKCKQVKKAAKGRV